MGLATFGPNIFALSFFPTKIPTVNSPSQAVGIVRLRVVRINFPKPRRMDELLIS